MGDLFLFEYIQYTIVKSSRGIEYILPNCLQTYYDNTLKYTETVQNYSRVDKLTYKLVLDQMRKRGYKLYVDHHDGGYDVLLRLGSQFTQRLLMSYAEDYPIERALTDTDIYTRIINAIGK
jgi:hypothetical protein